VATNDEYNDDSFAHLIGSNYFPIISEVSSLIFSSKKKNQKEEKKIKNLDEKKKTFTKNFCKKIENGFYEMVIFYGTNVGRAGTR